MFSNYDVSDRHRVTWHAVITLQSPLSHIGEVTGNTSNLNTLKVLDLEGNPRPCFVYSGNALRNGVLRRRGVARALTSLLLTLNPDTHHTMFAGGRIDGSTGNDMDLDRQIRQLMPWLSVLGTAKPVGVFRSKDAQMVQGRINVGNSYLVCYESAAYLAEQFPAALPPDSLLGIKALLEAKQKLHADPFVMPEEKAIAHYNSVKSQHLPLLRKQLKTFPEHICIAQTTRRDSTQDPNLRGYLESQTKQLSLIGEAKKEKEKKSDQMIASDRLIMAGSKLYSRWDFYGTEIEEGFIYDALLGFAEFPYLGGKGQRGCGLASIELFYQSGEEKGQLANLGSGNQILGDRFNEKHQRYQEYLTDYRSFLEEVKDSQELRRLLGST